jgi:hypothetical protein
LAAHLAANKARPDRPPSLVDGKALRLPHVQPGGSRQREFALGEWPIVEQVK